MIPRNKWPTIYESVYPGDEFGEYLVHLEQMYYDSMSSDEMMAECLRELEHNLSFEHLVEHWHNYQDGPDPIPLHTYLGMTTDQYAKYLKDESYRPWHDEDYDNHRFLTNPGLPLAEEPK